MTEIQKSQTRKNKRHINLVDIAIATGVLMFLFFFLVGTVFNVSEEEDVRIYTLQLSEEQVTALRLSEIRKKENTQVTSPEDGSRIGQLYEGYSQGKNTVKIKVEKDAEFFGKWYTGNTVDIDMDGVICYGVKIIAIEGVEEVEES